MPLGQTVASGWAVEPQVYSNYGGFAYYGEFWTVQANAGDHLKVSASVGDACSSPPLGIAIYAPGTTASNGVDVNGTLVNDVVTAQPAFGTLLVDAVNESGEQSFTVPYAGSWIVMFQSVCNTLAYRFRGDITPAQPGGGGTGGGTPSGGGSSGSQTPGGGSNAKPQPHWKACMVYAPKGAELIQGHVFLGHVGFAFLRDPKKGQWEYGGVEGSTKSQFWIAKGSWKQMLTTFRKSGKGKPFARNYYKSYRCRSLWTASPQNADGRFKYLKRRYWFAAPLFDCLTTAVDVLRTYGARDLPNPRWPAYNWMPKNYYPNLGKYGFGPKRNL